MIEAYPPSEDWGNGLHMVILGIKRVVYGGGTVLGSLWFAVVKRLAASIERQAITICTQEESPDETNIHRINLYWTCPWGQRDRQPITNKFYEGDYYCYYFLPNHADDDIRPVDETPIKEATMSIRIDSGRTRLTFRQTKSDKGFYGNALEPYVLTGDLYRFEQSDIAYSFISNEDGRRFMALMFSYLEVATDIRYYMTMGMMTLSYNQTHVPLFQKMAVFRERQNLKDAAQAAVLRGILSLNSSPIILDSETCKKLIREDPVLENAFSPDKALLKDCMIFSEAAIRSSLFMISDKYDKTELLLKVRRSSLLPAHEIVSEEDFFARFIREYQIRQMQGSKEEHAPVNDTANENTYSL